jgi:hypothetical protein
MQLVEHGKDELVSVIPQGRTDCPLAAISDDVYACRGSLLQEAGSVSSNSVPHEMHVPVDSCSPLLLSFFARHRH